MFSMIPSWTYNFIQIREGLLSVTQRLLEPIELLCFIVDVLDP